MRLDEVVEFAENPEPRCPCVLLLDTSHSMSVDTSGSMSGPPIAVLNESLRTFKDNLTQDPLASRRVEVAVVAFDDASRVIQDFVAADQFVPPILTTKGVTSMGSGILTALDLVQQRKRKYQENGVSYYRPWIFMITDGAPTDSIEVARQRIKEDEASKRIAFFAVGVQGADMEKLTYISVRAPVLLNGLNFAEMFVWLSASMQRISQSQVGEQVALAPIGWGAV